MLLPTPQVSYTDQATIAKLRDENSLKKDIKSDEHKNELYWEKLGNQTQHSMFQTELRTPRLLEEDGHNSILVEAKRVKAIINSSTPLIEINEFVDLNKSDFSGLIPKKRLVQTPNPAVMSRTCSSNQRFCANTTPQTEIYPSIFQGITTTPVATAFVRNELRLSTKFTEESAKKSNRS